MLRLNDAGEVTEELENNRSDSRMPFLAPFLSNFKLFFDGGATSVNRSQPIKQSICSIFPKYVEITAMRTVLTKT